MDTLSFWQTLPSRMDPVIFSIGAFRVQWYGLMYIVAFVITYWLAKRRCVAEAARFPYDDEMLKNLLTYAFFGVLVGGRLGYALFYNLSYYADHPLEVLLPFRSGPRGFEFVGISGMSYHGGLTGCALAMVWFARKNGVNFWNLTDLFAPAVPLGYTFGRIANFINGELWGRATTSGIGMRFPDAPGEGLRHPSQLYEATFEGVVMFAILWSLRKKPIPHGAHVALYLFGYGFVRFFIEYYREPDAHLGLPILNLFSMGQGLCIVMMAVGVGFYLWRRAAATSGKPTA
jgi:phosphatidylglycerol:prolipoprotein diacylglycerol transferase